MSRPPYFFCLQISLVRTPGLILFEEWLAVEAHISTRAQFRLQLAEQGSLSSKSQGWRKWGGPSLPWTSPPPPRKDQCVAVTVGVSSDQLRRQQWPPAHLSPALPSLFAAEHYSYSTFLLPIVFTVDLLLKAFKEGYFLSLLKTSCFLLSIVSTPSSWESRTLASQQNNKRPPFVEKKRTHVNKNRDKETSCLCHTSQFSRHNHIYHLV